MRFPPLPPVIPAKAGIQGPLPRRSPWTPAFAGVTREEIRSHLGRSCSQPLEEIENRGVDLGRAFLLGPVAAAGQYDRLVQAGDEFLEVGKQLVHPRKAHHPGPVAGPLEPPAGPPHPPQPATPTPLPT